jgi:hypothetical protein
MPERGGGSELLEILFSREGNDELDVHTHTH